MEHKHAILTNPEQVLSNHPHNLSLMTISSQVDVSPLVLKLYSLVKFRVRILRVLVMYGKRKMLYEF